MEPEYSVELCNQLKDNFVKNQLHRPMRTNRYDAGDTLSYQVTGISQKDQAQINLEILKFVGGGFAGQVYKIKILDISGSKLLPGLDTGGVYAMKILIPPSSFSLFFRNLVYRIGFQGPFQLQVNPVASRAGALWQKFIRRGAQLRFGDEASVNDIHATFVDQTLGSCGELSDWVDGRTWRLEVDDRLDLLKRYIRKKKVNNLPVGSPEYRTKRRFMKEFVALLQDMGAYEFARQYEWSTCKSQPNCLKLNNTETEPTRGLIAVDFRAGLALLPFLPMSPGDFKLIIKGLARGSLVQFDRGNLHKLEKFINNNSTHFSGMNSMLEELKSAEKFYRNSLPDITHNFFRLFYSKTLWSTMLKSIRTGWRIQNKIDVKTETFLNRCIPSTMLFYFLGAVPFLGGFIRKLWGRSDWRRHYGQMVSSWNYLKRGIRAKSVETALHWYRDGRINQGQVSAITGSYLSYSLHRLLAILPTGLHRFLTQGPYFKDRIFHIFIRPLKLYFSGPMREQWLRDMVAEGRGKHILSEADAGVIESQIKEPFIQKYLKSLAVHVCTLPVTQVVSVIVSAIYVKMHPELSYAEAMAAVAAILVLFQITPVSPGSLVRGFYVVYLMVKDRNFKDYNIAILLSFFKYIGYLAFPIQMTYRYPELARFMAVHWATEAVHVVPVFGERGALLEHWVFRLFYNWPLTIRSRMRLRAEKRAKQKSRYWHVMVYSLIGSVILAGADFLYYQKTGTMPVMIDTWWLAIIVALAGGSLITRSCGGAVISKRFISAMVWGITTGLIYTAFSLLIFHSIGITPGNIITECSWRIFSLAVLGTISAVITELRMRAPDLK